MSSITDIYKKRIKKSQDFCYPFWEEAIDNYNHYWGKLKVQKDNNEETEKIYPFASKVTTGISFDVIETMMPRIIGRSPEFITAAIEPDDIPAEAVAKMVIESQYDNPKLAILGEPIYLKLQKMVKEALITGTAIGRGYWRREYIDRPSYKAVVEKTGKEGEIEDIEKYLDEVGMDKSSMKFKKQMKRYKFIDDFDLKHIPFFFFFPDPFYWETGKMRFKIERDFYTEEQLKNEAEIFGYDRQQVKEALSLKGGFTPDISKNWLFTYQDFFGSLSSDVFNDDDERIRMFIVDKMWENGKVFVFVNESVCLTPEGIPSPYDSLKDPFIFSYNITQPHSLFGKSEISAFKKVEDNINDLLNMRNDNLFSSMRSFYLVNPEMFDDDPDSFVPYPNSVYKVRDIMSALREVKGQDVTAAVYKETSELYNYIQRVSGITDYVKGAEGMELAGRTYGGLRLAQEVANVRFLIKSTLFEEVTLRALGYMILEMSRQYINSDRVVRLVGEKSLLYDSEFYKIEASQLKKIKGFMDIKVIPSSTRAVDEQAEAMKLNGLADRIGIGRPPFDRITPELQERFLLKYLPLFGFRDASYWIRKMRESVASGINKEQSQNQPPKPTEEIMTSSGIQTQPSPLAQLIENQAGVNTQELSQANNIPIQELLK
jgi:hypothetical protein